MKVFSRSRILNISNKNCKNAIGLLVFLVITIVDMMTNSKTSSSTIYQVRRQDAPFLMVRFNGTYLSNNHTVRYWTSCGNFIAILGNGRQIIVCRIWLLFAMNELTISCAYICTVGEASTMQDVVGGAKNYPTLSEVIGSLRHRRICRRPKTFKYILIRH